MTNLKPRADLPKQVVEKLQHLYQQLGLPQLATRLMQEVLTPVEAKLLERARPSKIDLPIDEAGRILRIVTRQRGLSLERALLDLSRELDLIAAGRYESLRRAIGEPTDGPRKSVPQWDAASGELHFKGRVVRKVGGRATNIRLLLDSFEEQHWKARIDSPFKSSAKSRQLRDTLDSLRDDLQLITFRSDGHDGVQWLEGRPHRRSAGA